MSQAHGSQHDPRIHASLVFQHSHLPGGEAETFQDQFRDAMKAAPWYGISVAFHAVLLLVLMNVAWSSTDVNETRVIQTSYLEDLEDVLEDKKIEEEDIPPDEKEVELEDPVVSEDQDVPTDEVDENLSRINNDAESRDLNDVLGTGGGWGGGPGGGKYRIRGTGKGGGTATQRVVELGLTWLKNHQHEDGYWDCDDFAEQCETNLCNGKGDSLHDVGVTGLSLLAFLGAGNTKNHGPHKNVVHKGLRYLAGVQDRESGCFGPQSGQHFLYDHALAALAMVEAYHLSNEPMLKGPAQKGLDFISRARNPYKAWRYAHPGDGDNDVSVTGWMLFALFAGKDAGLLVDQNAIEDGMQYVESMTDPTTWRTGYHERGSMPAREPEDVDQWPAEHSESMTAVAMLLRAFDHQDPARTESMKGGADLMLQSLPDWNEKQGSIDFYYWYYGSYAMWQIGGRSWDRWQRSLVPSIVDHQRKDGDERGSWDPQVDPWGDTGGRVYATAINTLSLEVYYRYDKVFGGR